MPAKTQAASACFAFVVRVSSHFPKIQMAALLTAARRAAATPLILGASAAATTTTTHLLAASAPLLRRAVCCPASLPNAGMRTSGFSSAVLGNRPTAPTHLATAGSALATRGLASKPQPYFPRELNKELFSPELNKELHRVEESLASRHEEVAQVFKRLQEKMKKEHALHKLTKANSVVKEATVGWRIVYGSLAAGAVGIWYVLHTKSLWTRELRIMALTLLTEMVAKLQDELEEEVKVLVREELEKAKKN